MIKALTTSLILVSVCLVFVTGGLFTERTLISGRYMIGFSGGSFIVDRSVRDYDLDGPSIFDLPLLPTACVLLITALFIAALRDRLINSRRRAGFCASCGYDLRATPSRCPECGAEPTSQTFRPGHPR
jgi:hypothetical protein